MLVRDLCGFGEFRLSVTKRGHKRLFLPKARLPRQPSKPESRPTVRFATQRWSVSAGRSRSNSLSSGCSRTTCAILATDGLMTSAHRRRSHPEPSSRASSVRRRNAWRPWTTVLYKRPRTPILEVRRSQTPQRGSWAVHDSARLSSSVPSP